jgi:uncharacterized protein YjdB
MKRKRLLSCLLSLSLLLSYLTIFPQATTHAASNLAAGKLPTASTTFSNIAKATDGIKSATSYTDSYPGSGLQWVKIDLGASFNINNIKLWHYFGDGRKYHDIIVQLSNDPTFSSGVTTVFNNDNDGSAKWGVGTNSEYIETSSGLNITFNTVKARYVRFFSNGSTANSYNHYSEIEINEAQAQPASCNLALGKVINTSAGFSDISKTTDGIKSTSNFADSYPTGGLQWVQVDLGESCFIRDIKVWHYFGDERKYHDVIVQLSNDPGFSTGVTTVYNNDANNSSGLGYGIYSEYAETGAGLEIPLQNQQMRYVRFYSNGSTANSSNHYGEIEIYGTTPHPETGNLAAGKMAYTSAPCTNVGAITDSNISTANYADSYNNYYGSHGAGLQSVTIDLCMSYNINNIKLWHYYGDARKYHDVIVQLSNDPNFQTGVTTVFNTDATNYACQGTGKDSEYAETSSGLNLNFAPVNARYARFFSNGSTVNEFSHYVEIQIFGDYAEHVSGNVADGKLPTSSTPFSGLSLVTDSVKNTDKFADSYPAGGLQWLQMDLGDYKNINDIKLWHYYGDSRKYHDVVVQLSNDPTFANGVTTVYNNDADNSAKLGAGTYNEYEETKSGLDISFSPVKARYARFYSNGSTANSSNHYVEIEMYEAAAVIHPVSVNLSKATDTVAIGGTDILSAAILPLDASNKNVTWSSDAPDVASVSQVGTVTGLKAGTAVITATTADGSLTSSCTVTVTAPVIHPVSISLGIDGTSTVYVNPVGTYQLTATVLPIDTTNKNVIWSSFDTSIATVSQTGLVTGVKEGLVSILATTEDGSLIARSMILVTNQAIHPSSVTLDKSNIKLLTGQTDTLSATVLPSNAADKSVVWASSNPIAVTVSQSGLVTAVAPGGSTITAKTVDGNLSVSCDVYVFAPQPAGNLALGKLPDFPDPGDGASATFKNLSMATDGIKSTSNFADSYPSADGLQWVQVELNPNQSYDIGYIKLWHYFGDGRKYHDVIVQVSESPFFSPGSYITVYNNDTDNSSGQGIGTNSEYSETIAGLSIEFPTTKARYVRFYSNGSTANKSNHYSEIEIYKDKASSQ